MLPRNKSLSSGGTALPPVSLPALTPCRLAFPFPTASGKPAVLVKVTWVCLGEGSQPRDLMLCGPLWISYLTAQMRGNKTHIWVFTSPLFSPSFCFDLGASPSSAQGLFQPLHSGITHSWQAEMEGKGKSMGSQLSNPGLQSARQVLCPLFSPNPFFLWLHPFNLPCHPRASTLTPKLGFPVSLQKAEVTFPGFCP